MHIIGLVEHAEHVCCRYRLEAYRRAWQADGHRLEVRAIPRGFWGRWFFWRGVRPADVVIVQRRLLSGFHLLLLRRHARFLIFDFDDAVYRRDSYAARKADSTLRRCRFTAMIHAADLVVAGNDFLAGETARFIHPSRIRVIPTCIEPSAYPMAEHRRQGMGVKLAWIGSSSTLQGLERQAELLDQMAEAMPGVSLRVICDRMPRFARMPIEEVTWHQSAEAASLAGADIGISWVPDDPWSRGKCGLKVLQYMAAGLPVIANPVGVQGRMVRHGETGLLAETREQWLDAVQMLAERPDLRRRMGEAGRKMVEREYSVAIGAGLWRDILGGSGAAAMRRAA